MKVGQAKDFLSKSIKDHENIYSVIVQEIQRFDFARDKI